MGRGKWRREVSIKEVLRLKEKRGLRVEGGSSLRAVYVGVSPPTVAYFSSRNTTLIEKKEKSQKKILQVEAKEASKNLGQQGGKNEIKREQPRVQTDT